MSKRSILLLSLAISIAIPASCRLAMAEESAPPAKLPESKPAEASNLTPENLTAPPPEIKPRKQERKTNKVQKSANFEQMERHKADGYYAGMSTAPTSIEKGANFEQQQRHDGEGYYREMKATPTEYPKEPEPPKYVPPPAAVVPVLPPRPHDPNEKKFDDDPGKSGSITFERGLKTGKEMLSAHPDYAKRHFKEAMHVQPENPETYPGYIEACQRTNDWSETQHGIEKLVQLQPTMEKDYSWQLGEALFHLNRYDKAVPQLKKSLAYGHHQEQIHRMLLKIAQVQANNVDVCAEYAALCKLKPADYKTHIEFGALLERLAKPQEAIAQYRAATAANPADGATFGRLAYLIMYHNKDYNTAIDCYNKAMAADPGNAKAYQDGIAYCMQQKNPPKPKAKKS